MKDKLKSGKITKREYDSWVEEEEDYLESVFESEGIRWYDNFDRSQRLDGLWEIRNAERKGDTGFLARKTEQKRKEKESIKTLVAQMDSESAYFKKHNITK